MGAWVEKIELEYMTTRELRPPVGCSPAFL